MGKRKSRVNVGDNLHASNNRAPISGKSALIFNAPSAWLGAVRDNPLVGEQIWHHPMPAGAHGRFLSGVKSFWDVWNFSKNRTAAKDLIEWLGQREQASSSPLRAGRTRILDPAA